MSMMSSCMMDSVCRSSTAQAADITFSSASPKHSAESVRMRGLMRLPPSSEYRRGSWNSEPAWAPISVASASSILAMYGAYVLRSGLPTTFFRSKLTGRGVRYYQFNSGAPVGSFIRGF